jgi:hypothetical protein
LGIFLGIKSENVGFWVWVEFWVATPNTVPKPRNFWVQLYVYRLFFGLLELKESIGLSDKNHKQIISECK